MLRSPFFYVHSLTAAIIDYLEMIDINHHDCQRTTDTGTMSRQMGNRFFQSAPVQCPGQPIA